MEPLRTLSLPYESISSLSGGSNEVRVYHDELLDCERVGKRYDLTMVDASVLPEAKTLQAIDHKNVLEVVNAAKVSGYDPSMKVIEIFTPFYPKGSITDALLEGERLGGQLTKDILLNALLGLRELHVKHNILHRDLKSGNILLTDPPVYALIADLGVAGRLDGAGEVPAINNPTLYSPPELLSGNPLTVASDLYSIGHILRELMAGPFAYAKYDRAHVVNHLEQGISPLCPTDASLPFWASTPVFKLHAKLTATDPAKRYQSAREVADALRKVQIADWRRLDDDTWDVARHPNARPKYQVEVKPEDDGWLISFKKHSGTSLRRPQGASDFHVPSLSDKPAQHLFDKAHKLAFVGA